MYYTNQLVNMYKVLCNNHVTTGVYLKHKCNYKLPYTRQSWCQHEAPGIVRNTEAWDTTQGCLRVDTVCKVLRQYNTSNIQDKYRYTPYSGYRRWDKRSHNSPELT